MKKKEAGAKILIAAFILIICLSWLWWMLLGRFVDAKNYENRKLAERPALSAENYAAFPQEYTAYFNDNVPFRSSLIKLNNRIDYFAFKRASNEHVIIGPDNWLFYDNKGDGDPIANYQGTDLYSEEELEALAENCLAQRDLLAEQGKEFVIMIAPNKERILSEYLTERYGAPAENYRALQIFRYLKEHTDLRVVYPYGELMEAKSRVSENIWYKTDTHWNYIGGYVGASALLKELGIEMPAVDSDEITISDGGGKAGDLAGMLNLKKELKFADHEYRLSGYDDHGVEELEWDFNGMIRYQAEGADSRTVFVIRDSFSSHMALYIGSQFNKTYLKNVKSYTPADLEETDPDVVVYETVERYADRLSTFSIR